MNIQEDLDTLKKGTPYIRSILAFLLHLRFGGSTENISTNYRTADFYIKQLTKDVKNS